MIILQILLILVVVALMFVLLRSYSTRTRALTKIATFLFAIFAITAIVLPNWTTRLARLIGIGRGADLLLYGLCVVVMFMVVSQNLQQRRDQQRFAKVIRELTLLCAPDPGEAPKPEETETDGEAE